MNAGHFRKNHVSTGDLNRGRRASPRVLFGYFLHNAKSDNSFPLQGASRFCKPRISTLEPQLRTATIETFQGSFEVFQTSNQRTQTTISHNPIKSFSASRLLPPPSAAVFPPCGGPMLLPQHFSPPCGGSFGAKSSGTAAWPFRFAFLFAFAQICLNLRKIHLVIRHTVLDGIRRHGTHAFAHPDADRHHAEV